MKVFIDELTPFTDNQLQAASALASLDVVKNHINNCIDEATDAAMIACSPLRQAKTPIGGTIANVQMGTSGIYYQTLPVPTDFLRISYIKMAKWERGVSTTTPVDSEVYKQIHNPYTTAWMSKPVVILDGGGLNNILELYGSRVQDTLEHGYYVRRVTFGTTAVSVNELIFRAICWRCAGEVMAIMARFNEFKAAQGFYEEAVKQTFIN